MSDNEMILQVTSWPQAAAVACLCLAFAWAIHCMTR